MVPKFVITVFILAFLSLAIFSVVEAACKWSKCHSHWGGDFCEQLGKEWRKKDWGYCNGIMGRREWCCKL